MTKDVLMLKFEQGKLTKEEVREFFESNVCIPKGENRHPHYNFIHAYAEGASIQHLSGEWIDEDYPQFFIVDQYRIKPSEPVYEYLFYDAEGDTQWLTDSDFEFLLTSVDEKCKIQLFKAKETKRERKQ